MGIFSINLNLYCNNLFVFVFFMKRIIIVDWGFVYSFVRMCLNWVEFNFLVSWVLIVIYSFLMFDICKKIL